MELGVFKAIAAVSADLAQQGISKDRRNQQQGYSFRGIDDVLNALAPALTKHGLVILPRILGRECVERTSKSGSAQFFVTVEAEFDFVAASDGSRATVRTYGEAQDSADKATNKAMSAAYKYAAFLAFCIPVEGMAEDADAHTPEATAPRQPRPVTHPVTPPPAAPDTHSEPAGDDWRRVTGIKAAKKGQSAKGPWTLWIVTLDDGAEFKTFDDPLAAKLSRAQKANAPVLVSADGEGKLTNAIIRGEALAS